MNKEDAFDPHEAANGPVERVALGDLAALAVQVERQLIREPVGRCVDRNLAGVAQVLWAELSIGGPERNAVFCLVEPCRRATVWPHEFLVRANDVIGDPSADAGVGLT